MKNTYIFSFLVVLIVSGLVLAKAQSQGYSIEVKVNGFSDSDVILGHYFASQTLYPDDTARFDKYGRAVFTGNKSFQGGLYFIYLPNGQPLDFIMGSDQHFSIETDTVDFARNMKVKGSADNEIFSSFQLYMLSKMDEMKSLQEQLKDTTLTKAKKDKLQESIQKLNQERIDRINTIATQNPNLFVSTFLKATLEVEIPDSIKNNQQKAYNYYKKHYFDNFDLSDIRLLQTPMYEGKLKNYIDNMVLQIPDSINKEVDMIVEKSRADSAIFRYVLITLFNKYAKSQIMGMDAVQVHIAEKYYIPEAWWSDEKFITDLKERVTVLNPLLLGKVAPDVELRVIPKDHFIQAANDTTLKKYPHAGYFMNVSDVKADFTVLLFWEASCSHCKKVVPDLYQLYQKELKADNIEVLAISTLFGEDGKQKWIDFVNNHQLYNWINAWNPYDYSYKLKYDIRSTPQIYVLNSKKEIIGKKLAPEDIHGLISAYKKSVEAGLNP